MITLLVFLLAKELQIWSLPATSIYNLWQHANFRGNEDTMNHEQ